MTHSPYFKPNPKQATLEIAVGLVLIGLAFLTMEHIPEVALPTFVVGVVTLQVGLARRLEAPSRSLFWNPLYGLLSVMLFLRWFVNSVRRK